MPAVNKSTFLPVLSFLRRRRPTMADMEVLMDMLPEATLLLDMETVQVVLANAKATELTAFTRAELAQLDLKTLFPGLASGSLRTGVNDHTAQFINPLATHNGLEIEVHVTLSRLDVLGPWTLATLESTAVRQQQEGERQRNASLREDLLSLAQAPQELDFECALQAALQAGHALIGANILGVYLGDISTLGLHRVAAWGAAEILPEDIPLTEADTLREVDLWVPGKRATTELRKAARVSRLAYLASAPLGRPDAIGGLAVIADPSGIPDENILPLLQILAATLNVIVQAHSLRSHLLEMQAQQATDLVFGEALEGNVQEGVIRLKSDLTILDMNPFAELALGFAITEVRGHPVENVLVGADNFNSALESALQGIPTHNLGNVRLHRRDGVAFLAHMRVLPVMVSEKLQGILILLGDHSEHEQVQLRNQQLEQRAILGEVTAIFAHEVRNPINNLSTGLQVMAMNLPEDDPNRDRVNRLEQDCNRLSHLMDSILSFSRPMEYKMENVDVGLLVERLLERWHPRMKRVDVQHYLTNGSKNPIVNADPRALEQVFTNLVSNSVQAMSDNGGTLSVTIRTLSGPGDRSQVEISLADSGPGIPAENLARIFEPFFTTNSNGTGLGLAISKRIVTAHKGTIDATSVPGGTVFQILLPAVEGI